MNWSLKRRFLLTSLGISAAALIAAGMFLYVLFERDFSARVQAETHNQLMQLVSGLEVDPAGKVVKTQAMTDPRFRQPNSGLYWQVESKSGEVLRSRSLWDATLATGDMPWQDIDRPQAFPGPFGEPVLIHAKLIALGEGDDRQQLRVMIAVNESEVTRPTKHFAINLVLSLLVLGLAMLVVSANQQPAQFGARHPRWQVLPGLRPIPRGNRTGRRQAELASRATRADGGTRPLASRQFRP